MLFYKLYILITIVEHVISIIASMLRNCKGQQRQRLLSKFTENDYEKVDRLMELHFKYLEKVEEVEKNTKVRKRKYKFLYMFYFKIKYKYINYNMFKYITIIGR